MKSGRPGFFSARVSWLDHRNRRCPNMISVIFTVLPIEIPWAKGLVHVYAEEPYIIN